MKQLPLLVKKDVYKRQVRVCLAIQHTDDYAENIFSYVNNIPTAEGGTHEMGFKAGFTRALNDYARKVGALKEKDNNLIGEDFREGITAVLATFVRNPQFEGQTKGLSLLHISQNHFDCG